MGAATGRNIRLSPRRRRSPPPRFEDRSIELKLDTQDGRGRYGTASQRADQRTFSHTGLPDVIPYGTRRIGGLLLRPAQQVGLDAQGLQRPLLALATERSKPLQHRGHWTISRICRCVSSMVL
jgi:hypothetical protein